MISEVCNLFTCTYKCNLPEKWNCQFDNKTISLICYVPLPSAIVAIDLCLSCSLFLSAGKTRRPPFPCHVISSRSLPCILLFLPHASQRNTAFVMFALFCFHEHDEARREKQELNHY